MENLLHLLPCESNPYFQLNSKAPHKAFVRHRMCYYFLDLVARMEALHKNSSMVVDLCTNSNLLALSLVQTASLDLRVLGPIIDKRKLKF